MNDSLKLARCLMIQGTGSGVGKSVLTAAFCRKFYLDGWRVAPFKAQNMSLNSFVTEDGGEMGRAQVYQAEACGLKPEVAMNPVLLKPFGDNMSQVILMGKPVASYDAKNYYKSKPRFLTEVMQALNHLRRNFQLLVLEGAGSPAEINLRDQDFVNMTMAEAAEAPVIIVGDIDKGGVFAWMKGTYDLLTPEEKNRVAGFLINKFRGDMDILKPGISLFEEMVHKPVLGVLPFYRDLYVDEEDALPPMSAKNVEDKEQVLDVAILRLPRISNFTDFSPLAVDPAVSVRYVWNSSQVGNPDLLIIPGTRNTIDDLQFMKDQGLTAKTFSCLRNGTVVLGICGGLQILGGRISDPDRIESRKGEISGMGVFDLETTFMPEKVTRQVSHTTCESQVFPQGLTLKGYEIHMGRTHFSKSLIPLVEGSEHFWGGMVSPDGNAVGTYLHGFLDEDTIRLHFLNHVRKKRGLRLQKHIFNYQEFRNKQLDRLATMIDDHIEIEKIYDLMQVKKAGVS